jgi:FKBP-type peptidyl-prolyl cis-trans isomerase FklB
MKRLLVFSALGLTVAIVGAATSQDELPQGVQKAPGRAAQTPAAAAAAGPEYMQQVSYALGQNFAQQLRDGGVEGLDLDALASGINDVLTGAKPKWTEEECRPAMMRFSQEMRQKAMARMNEMAAKNEKAAAAFLAQNGKREGVQTTPSGLQYRVLKEGEGPSPTLGDTVKCNYRGTLLDGTEFDSSAQQGGPAEFQLKQGPGGLIPGWVEALQKMHAGDKWQLFVPPNLAYGADSPGPPIEPNSLLVFEIELVEILPQ